MKGTLVATTRDESTGLKYAVYLIKYQARLWLATFDLDHNMLVQVQEATLSADRVPEHVQEALQLWLL
ncbi:MAG: hypothetical protein NDI77_00915 [Geobacteraceae bacterium]|nr:hypothetical protein [Geobacteraceae bacterium]